MKTYVEKTLIKMREKALDMGLELPCDIYYNDWGVKRKEQFVVKLGGRHSCSGINAHFRSDSIRKSLKMALNWLKDYERDHLQGD